MQTETPLWRDSLRDPARWLTALLVVLTVAAFVIACLNAYGDVNADSFGHPEPLTIFVGFVVAVAAGFGVGSVALERGERLLAGLVTAVLGAGAVTLILVSTGKQTFPRAGGMWLLLSAVGTVLIGLLVAVGRSDLESPNPRRLALSALAAVVAVAIALAAAIAGPAWWRSHNVDRTTTAAMALGGAYPTSFRTVAWRHPLATGEEYAGTYGGRVMVAVTDLRGCRSGVRALDARTGREVWHYLVPNRCSAADRRVTALSFLGSDDVLQMSVGDTVGFFLDPKTGRVLDHRALHQALFFVSGNVGIAQDQSGSPLSRTPDNAKITVTGYDLAHRTEAWRRPAPTCAQGELHAVLGPPSRVVDSWNVHPTPGSSNSVVDLPGNGFAMGYSCRLSEKTFDQHVWIVRPGGRDQNIDLGPAQFVDVPPVPALLSTPQGLLVQTRAGVRNIGPDGSVKWVSSLGQSDEIRHMLYLDDGSVLLLPDDADRNAVRLDAASGRELSANDYVIPDATQVRGHLLYDTDTGGVVEDALHPVARAKSFASGVARGLLEASVLPGIEVIGGEHLIVGIR